MYGMNEKGLFLKMSLSPVCLMTCIPILPLLNIFSFLTKVHIRIEMS